MQGAVIVALGGLFGALGVVGAAYAAHGEDLRLAGTAAALSLVHAPALLALGLGAHRLPGAAVPAALWTLGILLFCGDLASRVVLGDRLFPGAAPIGGASLILGWLAASVAALLALASPVRDR